MKDIYMKPETAMVILDTCHICAGSPTLKWKVDKADVDDPEIHTGDLSNPTRVRATWAATTHGTQTTGNI